MKHSATTLRTLGTVLTGLVLIIVVPAIPANAHNSLLASDPASGSVIAEAPQQISLTFDQDVKNFKPLIAVTVDHQDPVEITPDIDGPRVTADLSRVDIPIGDDPALWRIGYRVVSADGHPVTGLVTFSVGDHPAVEDGGSTEQASAPSTEGRTGLVIAVAGAVAICVLVAGFLVRRRQQRRTGDQ